MSRTVTIDFEAESIHVQTQCDMASKALCKINKAISYLDENAKNFKSQELKKYQDSLLEDKSLIEKKLKVVWQEAEKEKSRGTVSGYEEHMHLETSVVNSLNASVSDLEKTVNELTGAKLFALKKFIDDGITLAVNDVSSGNFTDKDVIDRISKIKDPILQNFVYEQAINNSSKSFEEILELGKKAYQAYINKDKNEYVEEVKQELKENHIPQEVIDKVVNHDDIQTISSNANQAIMDESNRKKSLQAIIKSIKSRGFVVDTKKNLKIDRKTNIVNLVAVKPDGKTAEFKISLNGKFIYNFEGYEGHACNKDITPFMDDLEKIYGFKVTHQEIIDENPDKIQTQKYQYYNENKGTN